MKTMTYIHSGIDFIDIIMFSSGSSAGQWGAAL